MSQNPRRERLIHEGLITALAVGGFFIILGLVFVLTPGISQQTNNFFSDLTNSTRSIGGSTVNLPAPAHPNEHREFYMAVTNFLLGMGILQIAILVLRLAVLSRVRRIAETVGNLVFWLGAAVSANVFLLAGTLNGWWQFWSVLIVLVGVSLIVRFIVHFGSRSFRGKEKSNP